MLIARALAMQSSRVSAPRWCIGEILCASACGVRIVLCVMPGGEDAIETAGQSARSRIAASTMARLAPFHIAYSDVESVYGKLRLLPRVDVRRSPDEGFPCWVLLSEISLKHGVS